MGWTVSIVAMKKGNLLELNLLWNLAKNIPIIQEKNTIFLFVTDRSGNGRQAS
jgi:hypothetical protein